VFEPFLAGESMESAQLEPDTNLFRPALGFALRVFVPWRVAVSVFALLLRILYAGDLSPDPVFRPYLGIPPVNGGWRGLLVGVWQRWDTLWYMLIAREGYSLEDTRIFSPPLYPWLMRLVGGTLGGGGSALLVGGLIVSNLACLAFFSYLYALVAREWSAPLARRCVVYVAIFPTAFFLLAAYSESLFLLCVVAAFYHARLGRPGRRRWIVACLWASLAPLARLPGIVLVVPLGVEFACQWRSLQRTELRLAWWDAWPLCLPVLGGLAYPLYVRFVVGADSLWAPYWVHRARFVGRFAPPWQSVWQAMRVLASGHFRAIEPLDLFFSLLFVVLTGAAFVSLPLSYAIYMAVMLVGTLTKMGPVQPLLSLSRYVLVLFPGFVLLARAGERSQWWNRAIVYPSIALALFCVGQFVLWGWVG
jgi:hypothetical protein